MGERLEIVESFGRSALGKVEGKKRWFVRLIASGAGASGFHTESALRSTGALAWPVNCKINVDHPSVTEREDRPEGSLKYLAGKIVTTPEFRESPIPGLYAEAEFSDEWAPFVEQFHDIIGLSITASGWGDEVTDEGLRIIEGYYPDPFNTVDLVTEPGAGGRLLQVIESLRPTPKENCGKIVTESDTIIGEEMTPEQIAELKAEIVSAVVEALTPAEVDVEVEEDAVESLTASDIARAVRDADLPEAVEALVFDALGESVTEDELKSAIEKYGKVAESLVSEVNTNRVVESGAKASTGPLKVKGW